MQLRALALTCWAFEEAYASPVEGGVHGLHEASLNVVGLVRECWK